MCQQVLLCSLQNYLKKEKKNVSVNQTINHLPAAAIPAIAAIPENFILFEVAKQINLLKFQSVQTL